MYEFRKIDGVWHRRHGRTGWEQLHLEDIDIAQSKSTAIRHGLPMEKAGKRWVWKPVGQVSHYVCFTGGRDVDGPEVQLAMLDILTFMRSFYGVDLRVMHGGARGVDSVAGQMAEDLGIVCKAFPADWGRGRQAGIERNRRMAELLLSWEQQGHSVEVIAFPGGRGTAHMAEFSAKLGLNVTHIPIDGYGVEAS